MRRVDSKDSRNSDSASIAMSFEAIRAIYWRDEIVKLSTDWYVNEARDALRVVLLPRINKRQLKNSLAHRAIFIHVPKRWNCNEYVCVMSNDGVGQIRRLEAIVSRIHHPVLQQDRHQKNIGDTESAYDWSRFQTISIKERKYHTRVQTFPVKSVVGSRRGQEPCKYRQPRPTSLPRIWWTRWYT